MKLLLFLLLVFTVNLTNAQTPQFSWVKQLKGINRDFGRAIACDNNGNVYVASVSSNVKSITILQKIDTAGTVLWSRTIQGFGNVYPHDIAVDNAGNLSVVGYFTDTVVFDPDTAAVTFVTSKPHVEEVFILKLNTNGNFIWAKQLTGSLRSFLRIDCDPSGNVVVGGQFYDLTDFDPGPVVYQVSPTTYNINDYFLLKLTPNGDFVWVRTIAAHPLISGLDVDGTGNIYFTFDFYTAGVDFDPGVGTSYSNSSEGSVIEKLDANGNFLWVKFLLPNGSLSGVSSKLIRVNSAGDIYVAGMFYRAVDFDPGTGTSIKASVNNSSDIFIVKLDAAGSYKWDIPIGSTRKESVTDMAADNLGAIYLTGAFQDTVDFDPGSGTQLLSSTAPSGLEDLFTLKLNAAGNFVWIAQTASADQKAVASIASDGYKGVYTTGEFKGTVDFDPTSAVTTLTSTTPLYIDGYVLRLRDQVTTAITEKTQSCASVYPNPSTGYIILTAENIDKMRQVKLFNAIGQSIYFQMNRFQEKMEIRFDGPPGVYFLEIANPDNKKEMLKIYKE